MATLAILTFAETASACHACKQTPCVMAVAAPSYQCVTEMVPYTVYKQRKRIEMETVTETIMARVAETSYVYRQRCVNKPVWDTEYVQRQVTVCRPVTETSYATQQYTVCKPVSTTRQVTEYCMQPSTTLVAVPVAQKCGLCGKARPACGCQTVAQTTFTPVPVVRDVVETRMVAETMTRQVPVRTTHIVRESKVESVPIRHCRIVQEMVTDKIPRHHVPLRAQDDHPPDPAPGLRDGGRDRLQAGQADGPRRLCPEPRPRRGAGPVGPGRLATGLIG